MFFFKSAGRVFHIFYGLLVDCIYHYVLDLSREMAVIDEVLPSASDHPSYSKLFKCLQGLFGSYFSGWWLED